jgi:hypothetical protein
MSKRSGAALPPDNSQDRPARGSNLTLIYSLIVLAMIAALAIAAMIVLPFYNHR